MKFDIAGGGAVVLDGQEIVSFPLGLEGDELNRAALAPALVIGTLVHQHRLTIALADEKQIQVLAGALPVIPGEPENSHLAFFHVEGQPLVIGRIELVDAGLVGIGKMVGKMVLGTVAGGVEEKHPLVHRPVDGPTAGAGAVTEILNRQVAHRTGDDVKAFLGGFFQRLHQGDIILVVDQVEFTLGSDGPDYLGTTHPVLTPAIPLDPLGGI